MTLKETCKNLTDLVGKYQLQIESFHNETNGNDGSAMPSEETNKTTMITKMSNSSSSSSAISAGSISDHNLLNQQQQSSTIQQIQSNQDLGLLKNVIVSNLVTYSYDIAFTVKRIVCIMGAESQMN